MSKIEQIKDRLSKSEKPEHIKNLEITVRLQKTFLFEGYREYFTALIPTSSYSSLQISNGTVEEKIPTDNPFPTVLSHNDIHQNNILMGLNDNRDLLLIDNEYAGWNPMAMDIAVYINEVMIDNSHPGENGVKEYIDNAMSVSECERLIKAYMKQYYDKYMPEAHKKQNDNNCDKYITTYFPELKQQVWRCALLNNFFWGVWALALLSED